MKRGEGGGGRKEIHKMSEGNSDVKLAVTK